MSFSILAIFYCTIAQEYYSCLAEEEVKELKIKTQKIGKFCRSSEFAKI